MPSLATSLGPSTWQSMPGRLASWRAAPDLFQALQDLVDVRPEIAEDEAPFAAKAWRAAEALLERVKNGLLDEQEARVAAAMETLATDAGGVTPMAEDQKKRWADALPPPPPNYRHNNIILSFCVCASRIFCFR